MAEGLARVAFESLDICVQSAGLTVEPVDPRAVATMAEIGIDIGQTRESAVRDLNLGDFQIVVSVGIHRLGLERHQAAIAWDVPEFTRVTESTAFPRLRAVRDALSTRVRALGVLLAATDRA
jgi:protein-tyrosine-phosphatase